MLRIIDTSAHEATSTSVVAMPIDSALTADTVTASVGHMPSIMTKIGFCFQIPSMNSSQASVAPPTVCQRSWSLLDFVEVRHQRRQQGLGGVVDGARRRRAR